jgi:succinate dehydrogenase / fumarate reductase, cytochrome b subunit
MSLFANAVGRKVLMGLTGLFMLLFVVGHLLGNSTIFAGREMLNAYAEHLHALGPVVWIIRIVMGVFLVTHLFFGIILTMENSDANPTKYAVNRMLKATFFSQTMIWTGLLLLAFLVYHLLQFTVRITPDITAEAAATKPGDVYAMVVGSFNIAAVTGVYVAAMIALFCHLSHGIQSLFQSLGLSNANALPKFTTFGKVLATLMLLGFCLIPVSIITGILTK